jgi:hypothetical protein
LGSSFVGPTGQDASLGECPFLVAKAGLPEFLFGSFCDIAAAAKPTFAFGSQVSKASARNVRPLSAK